MTRSRVALVLSCLFVMAMTLPSQAATRSATVWRGPSMVDQNAAALHLAERMWGTNVALGPTQLYTDVAGQPLVRSYVVLRGSGMAPNAMQLREQAVLAGSQLAAANALASHGEARLGALLKPYELLASQLAPRVVGATPILRQLHLRAAVLTRVRAASAEIARGRALAAQALATFRQAGRYGTVVVGAAADQPPTIMAYAGLPAEYTGIAQLASDDAGLISSAPAFVATLPFGYWLRSAGGLASLTDDQRLSENQVAALRVSTAQSASREQLLRAKAAAAWARELTNPVTPGALSRRDLPPVGPAVTAPAPHGDVSNVISSVNDFDWSHGCSPTAGQDVMEYWSRNGYANLINPLNGVWYIGSILGVYGSAENAAPGYGLVQDSALENNEWDNESTLLAYDFYAMGTAESSGNTYPWNIPSGLSQVGSWFGYNMSNSGINIGDWSGSTWQIYGGVPVELGLLDIAPYSTLTEGHSVAEVGYAYDPSDWSDTEYAIINDTWAHQNPPDVYLNVTGDWWNTEYVWVN